MDLGKSVFNMGGNITHFYERGDSNVRYIVCFQRYLHVPSPYMQAKNILHSQRMLLIKRW